jgi:basic amino acid/polyamine antiporter, APA family
VSGAPVLIVPGQTLPPVRGVCHRGPVSQTLRARSHTAEAVLVGLGGMLGAGVFTGLAPAAALAGRWFLAGAVLAALVAGFVATAVAGRARAAPDLDGEEHLRERLGVWPARISGSAQVLGRAAAAAALAGTVGDYLAPQRRVVLAVGLIVLAIALDGVGLRLTGAFRWVPALGVLVVLGAVVAVCFGVAPPPAAPVPPGLAGADDPGGIAGAAGVMFFAFLGFGQAVGADAAERRAARWPVGVVLPVLIGVALAAYLAVGFGAYHQLGAGRLALSPVPLEDTLAAADAAPLAPVVRLGVLLAAAPLLLLVLAGARRAVAAAAVAGDLPTAVARPGRTGVPWRAGVLGGAAAVVATVLLPPAAAIPLAACAMLFHYAFVCATARLVMVDEQGRPAWAACLGMALCVVLAMSLPVPDLLVTASALVLGTGGCALAARRAR